MATYLSILSMLVGAIAMWLCDRSKRRLLRGKLPQEDPAGAGTEAQQRLATLRFPYNEVLLGLLLVMAIVLCAVKCMTPSPGRIPEFAFGYAAAILTSFGSFQRIRKAMDELGMPKLEREVRRVIIGFCIAMALFLIGVLTLTRIFLLK